MGTSASTSTGGRRQAAALPAAGSGSEHGLVTSVQANGVHAAGEPLPLLGAPVGFEKGAKGDVVPVYMHFTRGMVQEVVATGIRVAIQSLELALQLMSANHGTMFTALLEPAVQEAACVAWTALWARPSCKETHAFLTALHARAMGGADMFAAAVALPRNPYASAVFDGLEHAPLLYDEATKPYIAQALRNSASSVASMEALYHTTGVVVSAAAPCTIGNRDDAAPPSTTTTTMSAMDVHAPMLPRVVAPARLAGTLSRAECWAVRRHAWLMREQALPDTQATMWTRLWREAGWALLDPVRNAGWTLDTAAWRGTAGKTLAEWVHDVTGADMDDATSTRMAETPLAAVWVDVFERSKARARKTYALLLALCTLHTDMEVLVLAAAVQSLVYMKSDATCVSSAPPLRQPRVTPWLGPPSPCLVPSMVAYERMCHVVLEDSCALGEPSLSETSRLQGRLPCVVINRATCSLSDRFTFVSALV